MLPRRRLTGALSRLVAARSDPPAGPDPRMWKVDE